MMDFNMFQGVAMGGGGGVIMAWLHIKYLKEENGLLRDELKESRKKVADLAAASIEAITLNNHLLSTQAKGDADE